MLKKNYTDYDFLTEYGLLNSAQRILNAGSASRRYGKNCVNIDIQDKPNVDVVCDIHELPDSLRQFDEIICQAVLQYCWDPYRAAHQLYLRLKPRGYLFMDAPWVQPYCPDTPDRFRFSEEALRSIFSDFEVIKIGCSIRPGSAFAMLGIHIAQTLTHNKYANFMLKKMATLALFPFTAIRTVDESKTAGAFYMICRKPG